MKLFFDRNFIGPAIFGVQSYILKRNGFFVFCLSADYFGTDKGYKLEIVQEGVVSKYKEFLFCKYKKFTSSPSKGDKTFSQLNS